MASKKSNKNKAAELEGQPVVAETSPTETPVPEPAAKKQGRTRLPGTPKAAKANLKKKKAVTQDKKLSALDAAAKVLEEAGQPMNCQELIAAMAAKGYWSSPAGKTPASTLYSALLREIKTKASEARFQKAARGQFAYQTPNA